MGYILFGRGQGQSLAKLDKSNQQFFNKLGRLLINWIICFTFSLLGGKQSRIEKKKVLQFTNNQLFSLSHLIMIWSWVLFKRMT